MTLLPWLKVCGLNLKLNLLDKSSLLDLTMGWRPTEDKI